VESPLDLAILSDSGEEMEESVPGKNFPSEIEDGLAAGEVKHCEK